MVRGGSFFELLKTRNPCNRFRKHRDAAGRDVQKARADKKEPAELEARAAEEVWTKVAEVCSQEIIREHASMTKDRRRMARSILLQYVHFQVETYQVLAIRSHIVCHRCDALACALPASV